MVCINICQLDFRTATFAGPALDLAAIAISDLGKVESVARHFLRVLLEAKDASNA